MWRGQREAEKAIHGIWVGPTVPMTVAMRHQLGVCELFQLSRHIVVLKQICSLGEIQIKLVPETSGVGYSMAGSCF